MCHCCNVLFCRTKITRSRDFLHELLLKHLDVVGVNWGGVLPIAPELAQSAHTDLMQWFEAGLLNPPSGPVFDLEDGADAVRFFEDRGSIGKPVIRVR